MLAVWLPNCLESVKCSFVPLYENIVDQTPLLMCNPPTGRKSLNSSINATPKYGEKLKSPIFPNDLLIVP